MSEEDVIHIAGKLVKMGMNVIRGDGSKVVVVPPCHTIVYPKKKKLVSTELITIECKGDGIFEYKRVDDEIKKGKNILMKKRIQNNPIQGYADLDT